MEEVVRDQLSGQLESIMHKLWEMKKGCENLMIKVNNAECEMPEDADIVLSEMDDEIGDAMDAWDAYYAYLIAW